MKSRFCLRSRSVLSPVLVALAACSVNSDQANYTAIPDEQEVRVNTIVLTPASVPEGLEGFAGAMEEFDSLIAHSLENAGYTLVPADEYGLLWESILNRTVGLFDSTSGERNEAVFVTARQELLDLLNEQYQPDALLYPEIWVVDAPFAGGTARWDGVSQELVGVGTRIVDALGALFSASESSLPTGDVEAVSLVVFIENMDGQEIFANAGGIQVLEKVGKHPDERKAVPKEEWFADRSRNRRAVLIALGPILD
ncbi:MAG: hypothetical protein JSW51_11185 [Gemmatimonadota bacterium]|nr:MAG: hypothetical protein JSW51_11185 [Gemmatimonadota bacterium]